MATLAGIVFVAGGFVIGRQLSHRAAPTASSSVPSTTATTAPQANSSPNETALAADFAALQDKLHAPTGVVISAVGNPQLSVTLGDWQSGPAWSTVKVPLAIAALREEDPPKVTDAMRAAITESDNAAAESIWQDLGDPLTAGQKVEAVLRETGDPTIVQTQKVRPEYTAFGQTDWSLANQARYLSVAACDTRSAPILELMGQVEQGQSWGIGAMPGSRFKGGWGPSTSGSYLVRQIGILSAPTGMVAVAVAVEPASGSFAEGTQDLNEVANWLTAHIGALPAGQCAH